MAITLIQEADEEAGFLLRQGYGGQVGDPTLHLGRTGVSDPSYI